MIEDIKNQYEYELKYWIKDLQSMPVEEVDHEDYSESYEINTCHLFKLENGKYATVIECGCSCYDSDQALITVFEGESSAKDSFVKWKADNK